MIKHLYELSVKYNCVIVPIWISTHDNVGADALSRGDLGRFQEWAKDHMFNHPYQHSHSGAAASMGGINLICSKACVRLVSHTARDIIRAHAYTDNAP